MAREAFRTQRFKPETMWIIEQADIICAEYQAQNYIITLRQLYYQFIQRDLFPDSWIDRAYNLKLELHPDTKNTPKNYERLGSIINDARLAGELDWDYLEDKTRNLERIGTWDSPKQIIDAAMAGFRLDPWVDQPRYIQVWVEKQALEGIITWPARAIWASRKCTHRR